MPRRMVNGCYQKIKKHCDCGVLLTGLQSRYCSRACYEHQRKVREREHYAATHPPLPDKKCISCNETFTPKSQKQSCCTRICRDKITQDNNRKKRKTIRTDRIVNIHNPKWGTFKSPPSIHEIKTSTIQPEKSHFSSEITSYLNGGGEVTVYSPQENGRVPGVNLPLKLKLRETWSLDTTMGHGYELDLMDEIYTTTEVLNEL